MPGIQCVTDLMPETPNPNTPTSFFEALYTHFILRDFIGKIVPGGMFLYILWLIMGTDPSLHFMKDVSGFVVAGLAGLCWIIALPLQQFAVFAARVLFRSEFLDSETTIKFRRVATNHERSKYERFVISKEASGNAGAAIFLGCMFWVTLEAFKYTQGSYRAFYNPEGIVILTSLVLILAYSLLKGQAALQRRQSEYVASVLRYVDSSSLSSPTSEPTIELEVNRP